MGRNVFEQRYTRFSPRACAGNIFFVVVGDLKELVLAFNPAYQEAKSFIAPIFLGYFCCVFNDPLCPKELC